jgi:hypothetical protein
MNQLTTVHRNPDKLGYFCVEYLGDWDGKRARKPSFTKAVAPLDEDEDAKGGELFEGKESHKTTPAAHHLYQRSLSQHRGLLECRNSHFYDPGGDMHAELPFL